MSNRISTLLLATLIINNVAVAALNDTGITTCSNETQNGLPCPVAGFPGQDAEYGTNSFDFTKLDANGNAMPVTATNHVCVQDNVTGLMWEVKTDDGGLRDKDNTYTFDQAATFAANVNATNLCGHNDWRVPEIKELASIVDYSVYNPSIDEDFFPNTPAEWFWSASSVAYGNEYALIVDFYYGVDSSYDRTYTFRARLVCAGQSLSFVFADNANGTITDSSTGLIWAKCPLGQSGTNCEIGSASMLTWAQALNAAKNSSLAGRNDWRMPNIQELHSIVDYTKHSPSINSTYFPNTPAEWFWSASPYASFTNSAWFVGFNGGNDYGSSRASTLRARLVCAGQVLPFALSVAKAGNGAGSISSNPAGINCGAVCAANFTQNSSVTLTAAPAAGSGFGGWSGDTDCSDGTVIMDAAKNCTATFNLNITVPTATTGTATNITQTSAKLNGTVISSGATATVSFEFGTTTAYGTNIAATPSNVYSSTAVAVSANKTGLTCGTTYHFRTKATNSAGTGYGYNQSFTTAACPTYTLILTTQGAGNGTVTSTPAGINCGATCNANFTSGTTITLTATPAASSQFAGWSGDPDCSDGNVTMNANKSCTATFNLTVTAPTVTTLAATNIDTGSATLNGSVVSTGAAATVSFDVGSTTAYGTNLVANPAQVYSNTAVAVSANKTALTCNTLYHYRVTAVNSAGTGYGADKTFTTATCPVINSWLFPTNPIVLPTQAFTLAVTAKSNSQQIGSYRYEVTFDVTKLAIDYTQCPASNGVCAGSDAPAFFTANVNYGTNPAIITLNGLGAIGPGNDLQLLTIHFKSQNTFSITPVTLKTVFLDNAAGNSIGLGAAGASVNIVNGICGDADGNTRVNIVDALAIARKVVGMPPPPTVDVTLADVNQNGQLSIVDALHIARYSIGLVTPPEVCAIGVAL